VRSRAKLVLKTMKEYQDLESLISKYNLTTVAKRTGEIYIALRCSTSVHSQCIDYLSTKHLMT
jgi:hypothetical protein